MTITAQLLEKALQIAQEGHRGQRDKAGQAYILHPLRLMQKMSRTEEQITALLHDIIEDTDWDAGKLLAHGIPQYIVQAIECLSRQPDESYSDFITRVDQNPLARKVKLADIEDNLNILRLQEIKEQDLERLKRYHRAWHTLNKSAEPESETMIH